jgi:hypothetical protein
LGTFAGDAMGCNIKENENFAIFSSLLFQKEATF